MNAMPVARLRRLLLSAACGVCSLALAPAAKPQGKLADSGTSFVEISTVVEQSGVRRLHVRNLYSAALTQFRVTATCSGNRIVGTAESQDAELYYAPPLEPGKDRAFGGGQQAGCAQDVLDEAIFADGTAVGDQSEIEKAREKRKYAKDELHSMLEGEILLHEIGAWDPAQTLAAIQLRRSASKADSAKSPTEVDARSMTQDRLESLVTRFAARKNPDAAVERRRRSVFIEKLRAWEYMIGSIPYSGGASWDY